MRKNRHLVRDDHPRNAFMRFKGAAVINVLALVIAFFSLTRDVAAAFGMGSILAKQAMHHGSFLLVYPALITKTYKDNNKTHSK